MTVIGKDPNGIRRVYGEHNNADGYAGLEYQQT